MPRSPRPSVLASTFGPGGPMSPAVKILIWVNVAAFLVEFLVPSIVPLLGLQPSAVLGRLWLWQPVTYLFLHHDFFHILFNMLGIWMFGVELERVWGTKFFVQYYFVTGIGAAVTTILVGLLPFAWAAPVYYSVTIGASGALYGLLLAYAYYYPDRPILMFLLFPIPAKYFVMIIGAISLLASIGGQGGIAHAAHLGGLLVGFIYLKSGGRGYLGKGGGGLMAELKYRWVKWKMNRLRRKFDVYSGGRGPWDGTLH